MLAVRYGLDERPHRGHAVEGGHDHDHNDLRLEERVVEVIQVHCDVVDRYDYCEHAEDAGEQELGGKCARYAGLVAVGEAVGGQLVGGGLVLEF